MRYRKNNSMLWAIMQAQADTRPKPSIWVQIKVPTMRTHHMPMMLYTKGARVLPTPSIIPSMMMEKP